jgi:hypothetical protein
MAVVLQRLAPSFSLISVSFVIYCKNCKALEVGRFCDGVASCQAVGAVNVVCWNWLCLQRRISTSATCWNSFSISYLCPFLLLSLPLKFREISSFVMSLCPFYSLLSSERFPRFLSLSFLLSLTLKFREISSLLMSLCPFYSLSRSERFPRFCISLCPFYSLFLLSSGRFRRFLCLSVRFTLS